MLDQLGLLKKNWMEGTTEMDLLMDWKSESD